MFQAGNLDGISSRFAPNLASLLSPEAFRDGWAGIELRVGKLRSFGAPSVRKTGSTDSAVLPAKFEKADWTLTLAFDGDGKITSLRFAPASLGGGAAADAPPPPEFRAPPYAAPGKFSDSEVKIGEAPWILPGTLSMPAGKGPFPGAVAAVALLRGRKGVDPRRIVVLGHSQGGRMVPRIAAADGKLAGVVALAGSTRPIPDLVEDQLDYLVANGAAIEADVAPLRAEAQRIRSLDPAKTPPGERIMGAPPAYWLDLRAYDPGATARGNGIPILVLQAGRDYQVTGKDLDGWKKGLAGGSFATFHTFPKANHLFVFGEGKSLPAEDQKSGNVAADVVDLIATWVKALPPRR